MTTTMMTTKSKDTKMTSKLQNNNAACPTLKPEIMYNSL